MLRAREPEDCGYVDSRGARIHYEVFGDGGNQAIMTAALHPERIGRLVLIAPSVYPVHRPRNLEPFFAERGEYNGWEKSNANYWLERYEDYCLFFFGQLFNEPHSTKPTEDAISWALETTPEANRRPFIYIPLPNHFEQNLHVVHRIRQYGGPEPTAYDEATPARLAGLMRERLGSPVTYRAVETGKARGAASQILSLLG